MRKILHLALALLCLSLAQPVQAQFRSDKRTADKEFELNAFNLAIESYKRALARRPDDLESLSRIADSYRMLNQMQTAHSYYQQAIRNRRVSKETLLNHAHTLKALGRYDEAKQFYLLYAREYDQGVGNHFAQSCDFAMRQLNSDAGFVVQSSTVNSPVLDFGPSAPRPTQLIFNSARSVAGSGGQMRNQPYVAAIGPDGKPLEAFPITNGYTSQSGSVGPVSYSPDGTQVVFTRNNFTAGTRIVPETGITMNLLIADVNQEGIWNNVRPLPFNGTDFSTGFGTFSHDGNAIYFSSNRPEGYGGYDIYRARRQGQSWEAVPENLGTVVNTVGHEITPFFDGASLYFSSDWHHGMGTYDVFRAEMTVDRPSKLYHMGNGINSNRDDIGFVYDPVTNNGYLVSNRIGGSGQEDIYRVGRANSNLVLIVNSATDGSPVANAAVDFTACGGQVYAADISGRYVFQSVEGLNCDIVVGATGFQAVRIPLQGLQPDANNIVRVSLTPGAAGGNTAGPTGGVPLGVTPGTPVPPGSVRGYVTNAQTGYPLMDAQVVVTKRSTGQAATVRTSQDGAYYVVVEPYTTYDVMISQPGFETANFPVQTADGSNVEIFGNVTMLPTQGVTVGGGGTTPGGTTGVGPVMSGYSVQMASLGKTPDLTKFSNVAGLGRVYSVLELGTHKVRLGVFPTRAAADAAAASVKNSGYSGAFVVSDTGAAASGSTVSPPPPNTGGTTTAPVASAGSSPYKVQIGAYSKPENFDRGTAGQLGPIESMTRGNLTIFMIGGLQTVAQAEAVKARARTLGYAGAFILQNLNGSLQKL